MVRRWKLKAGIRKSAEYADKEAGCAGKASGRRTRDPIQHVAFMDQTLEATPRWCAGTPPEVQAMQLRGMVTERSQPVRDMYRSNR